MVFVGERKKKKEGPLFHCEQRKREREREMFPRLLIGWRGPEDESRTRRFFVTGIGYITRNFWWEAVEEENVLFASLRQDPNFMSPGIFGVWQYVQTMKITVSYTE